MVARLHDSVDGRGLIDVWSFSDRANCGYDPT